MEVLLGVAAAAAAAGRAAVRRHQGRDRRRTDADARASAWKQHRKNPACTSCHRVIDPLGLTLENFDATGAWRIKDNEVAGRLGRRSLRRHEDGRSARACNRALLKHSDVFLRSFTENLMTYALGRRVEYTDMPAIRAHHSRRGARTTIACRRSCWRRQQRRVPDGEARQRTR